MIGQKRICHALVKANSPLKIWTIKQNISPIFLANRCSPVLEIENVKADGILALPGNIVTYTCSEGYMFLDKTLQKSIQCNEAAWNDTQESCTGS